MSKLMGEPEAAMPATFRHFAITASDVEASRGFYEAVMGWRFRPWAQPDVLILEGAGVSGLIHTPVTVGGKPLLGLEPTFGVDDLAATQAAVAGEGGTIVQAPVRIEGVGELIRFEEPGGAMLVAMQYDRPPTAAVRDGAARVRHFAINADDVSRGGRPTSTNAETQARA
jgi:predicted enzyme related to lactoylglutathione lyase